VADQRITELAPLPQASVQADQDVLPIVDTSASETKKITAKQLFQAGAAQADPASIPASAIDMSGGVPGGGLEFTQGDVILGRDSSGPGPGMELACTAAGRALLDDANSGEQRLTLGLGSLATANGTWADGSIFSGNSSGTNTGDQIINLTGAVIGSGTSDITTMFGVGVIEEPALADQAVSNAKLADGAVGSTKLGDNSSTIIGSSAPVAEGLFIGQQYVNQNNGYAYYYNGVTWQQIAGSTTFTFNEDTPFTYGISYPIDANSPQIDISTDPQNPNTVWAGPSSGTAQGIPSFRALAGADLPAPVGTSKGGVYAGDGIAAAADGRLSLAAATASVIGGVSVSGTGLSLSPAGALTHTTSPLAPGTYTKVTTDSAGHVVGQQSLAAADIPNLDAGKLTSGTLDPARLAGKSVTRLALANYSISYIQENDPGIITDHIGCLWLQESTGQLRMWNGNSWIEIGFGRLAQENLRWGGIIDASTDQVTTITQIGSSAGLTVGNPLPSATDGRSGVYVVVGVPGSSISATPGVTYDNGDLVLCIDRTQGWTRIDTLSSGGGGGATVLNDLQDVTTTTPTNGQVLQFNSTLNRWVNNSLTGVSVTSVFGRSGAVVAAEGDYTLNQLSDVDLVTVPPVTGYVLRFNGTAWEPAAPQGASSPTTTQGDLIQRGVSSDQRLAIGTANQVLTVNATGTLAEWRTPTAATTAAEGVTRLATLAETTAGTLDTVAVTPASLKAVYAPLNFSALPTLP